MYYYCIHKGNETCIKQFAITISYFIALVANITLPFGEDGVVKSIDPAEVCQGSPLRNIY